MIGGVGVTELDRRSRCGPSMGGRLEIHIACPPESVDRAQRDADLVWQRVEAWAARLTRFDAASDLSRLNAGRACRVSLRPTLAAVLAWADRAGEISDGIVDVGMLDARLAAEAGADRGPDADTGDRATLEQRGWHLERHPRGAWLQRTAALHLDLDGVAKGWLADRALARLGRHRGAIVDADGDIALHAGREVEWLVGVADPREPDAPDLATFRVGGEGMAVTSGIATSGTTVHRWRHQDGATAHHLIDPRTRRPALTDVVQATVLASSARAAEVYAKSAVIVGSQEGFGLLERARVDAAVLLLGSGEVLALPQTLRWLA